MRFTTFTYVALSLASLAAALPSEAHAKRDVAAHARIARSIAKREPAPVAEPIAVPEPVAAPSEKKVKRDLSKRCKKPAAAHKGSHSSTSTSTTSTSTSSTASSSPTSGSDNSGTSDNNGSSGSNSGSSGSNSGSSGSSSSSTGLTTAASYCGGPAATSDAPNGAEFYLNCGMNGGGWAPPNVAIGELTYVKLRDAISSGSGVFDPCTNYLDIFESVAASSGVPDIFLASFAMQESTCNPSAVGPNGEQGLMQLTQDKCGNAPNGNCQDPTFNINEGATYIQQTISDAGGNVVQAVGQYNGYTLGQTISSVIANPNCGAQQNLDYLNQFFNFWLVNKNAYSSDATQYNNQVLCNSGELWKINVSA